jgi:hypothetical protein
VFTRAHHWSLPDLDQCSASFFQLGLGLPSFSYASGFPTKNLYAFLFSPIDAAHLAHLILLDGINCAILIIIMENK